MERRDNGVKVIAVLALVIAVAGLSIAYAAFSSSLTVNGTATVSSNWDIEWVNLTGNATGYATKGSLTIGTGGQSISGDIGTLTAPGDTLVWNWKVQNKGTINASLASATSTTLSCKPATSSSATQAEATALCSELSLSLKYNSSEVSGSTTGNLNSGASVPVQMTITYASTGTATISGPVTVSLVSTPTFTYNQATK